MRLIGMTSMASTISRTSQMVGERAPGRAFVQQVDRGEMGLGVKIGGATGQGDDFLARRQVINQIAADYANAARDDRPLATA